MLAGWRNIEDSAGLVIAFVVVEPFQHKPDAAARYVTF
jgi:hypothetical protein